MWESNTVAYIEKAPSFLWVVERNWDHLWSREISKQGNSGQTFGQQKQAWETICFYWESNQSSHRHYLKYEKREKCAVVGLSVEKCKLDTIVVRYIVWYHPRHHSDISISQKEQPINQSAFGFA